MDRWTENTRKQLQVGGLLEEGTFDLEVEGLAVGKDSRWQYLQAQKLRSREQGWAWVFWRPGRRCMCLAGQRQVTVERQSQGHRKPGGQENRSDLDSALSA